MPILWSEPWGYPNGTEPSTVGPGYTGTGGATANVQTGVYRLTSGDLNGPGKVARRVLISSVADVESRGSFTLVSTTGDYTFSIVVRGDSAIDSQNGYVIDVRNNGGTVTWQLVRAVNYAYTTLLALAANGLTAANGSTVNYAFRVNGTRVQAKLWTGATEPTTWAYDATDPSPYTAPGALGWALSATAGTNRVVDIGAGTIATPDTTTGVNAGTDLANIEPGDLVTLTATAVTGTPAWAQTGGTPAVTLGGSGAVRTFTAPATLGGTTLTFTATAGADSDSITVSVLPHNHWRFNSSMVLVPRFPTDRHGATAPPTGPPAWQPVIKPAVNGAGAQLQTRNGARLKLAGVNVWGISDLVAGSGGFGAGQYTNRATVINTIRGWGANHVRFRMLANNGANTYLTAQQQVDQITAWVAAATAAGLYSTVCWWDSLDGYAEDANWPARYASAFPQMQAVVAALGATNPYVMYEPFNEPNSFGPWGATSQWDQWLTAMKATLTHFRGTCGYKGVLAVDTIDWSHGWSDTYLSQLEAWDASRAGMTQHQLMFCKHDYANEYATPDSGFDSAKWTADTGGSSTAHVLLESEFGNYNGDPSTVHIAWSQAAAGYLGQAAYTARSNYAGGDAFLFGPWFDANAMTTNNVTPTTWGVAVNDFLGKSNVIAMRPPVG